MFSSVMLQVAYALFSGLCTAFALLAGMWCYRVYMDSADWLYLLSAAASFVSALAIAVYGYQVWKGLEDYDGTWL